MTTPPDWVINVPATQSVHTIPAALASPIDAPDPSIIVAACQALIAQIPFFQDLINLALGHGATKGGVIGQLLTGAQLWANELAALSNLLTLPPNITPTALLNDIATPIITTLQDLFGTLATATPDQAMQTFFNQLTTSWSTFPSTLQTDVNSLWSTTASPVAQDTLDTLLSFLTGATVTGGVPGDLTAALTTYAARLLDPSQIPNLLASWGGTIDAVALVGNVAASLVNGSLVNATIAGSAITSLIAAANIPALTATWGKTIDGAVLAGSIAGSLITGAITSATLAASALTAGAIPAGVTIAGSALSSAISAVNVPSLSSSWAGTIDGSRLIGSIAASLISGALTVGNIPNLPASQITSGTFTQTLIPSLTSGWGGTIAASLVSGALSSATLAGSALTGTVAGSIVSGALSSATLAASALTSGAIPAGVTIAGSALTSAIAAANVPTLGSSWAGTVDGSRLAGSIAGSLVSGALSAATLPATALTSGAIPAGVTIAGSALSSAITQANVPSLTSAWTGTLDGSRVAGSIAASLVSGALSGATLAATAVTAGALPAGVTLPGGQLTGSVAAGLISGALSGATLAATALTSGAIPAGVTLPGGQLTGSVAGSLVSGALTSATIAGSALTSAVGLGNIPLLPPTHIIQPTAVLGTANSVGGTSTTTTLSFSNTATAGDYVLVALTCGATISVTANVATYGGAAMTLLGAMYLNNVAANGFLALYGVPNAPGGAQTVSFTLSSACDATATCMSYPNVSAVSALTTAYGSSTSAAITPPAAVGNQMIINILGSDQSYFTSYTGGTARYNQKTSNNKGGLAIADMTTAATTTGTIAATTPWAAISVALTETLAIPQSTVPTIIPAMTSGLASIDAIVSGIAGYASTNNTVAQMQSTLANIAPTNILGAAIGGANIGSSVQNIVDAGVQAINGSTVVNNSLSQFQSAFGALTNLLGFTTGAAPPANSVTAIAQSTNNTLTNRAIYNNIFEAVDPTANAVFNITDIETGTLPTIPLTESRAILGYITTRDGGVKQAIGWVGYGLTSITAFFVTIYSVNTSNGTLTWLWSSGNIVGSVSGGGSPVWNWLTLPSANYITTAPGNLYVVDIMVTGTGTYNLLGKTSTVPALAGVVPQMKGAYRTKSPMPQAVSAGTAGTVNGKVATWTHNIVPQTYQGCLILATNVYTAAAITGANLTATCGATGMTQIVNYNYATNSYNFIFYLLNPPAGNQTITLTLASAAGGAAASCYLLANTEYFQNVASVSALNSATGTGTTANITTTSDPAYLVYLNFTNNPGGSGTYTAFNNIQSVWSLAGAAGLHATILNTSSAGILAGAATPVSSTWAVTAIGLFPIQPVPTGVNVPSSIFAYQGATPFYAISGRQNVSQPGIYAPVWLQYFGTQTIVNPAVVYPWANYFDIGVCGGGCGGPAGGTLQGSYGGANPGLWATPVTLTKAQMGSSNVTITIGAGGGGGISTSAQGLAGGTTSCAIPGFGTISASGGAATNAVGTGSVYGSGGASAAADNWTDHYGTAHSVPGGAGGSTPGASGSQPGGSGAGGYASTYSSLNGGNGANGTVWMMAYQ